MLHFIITGDAIAKKNSQIAFRMRNGRSMITSSAQYKKWAKSALKQLVGVSPWSGRYPVIMECYHYRSTKRAFDFSNMFEGVQDVLQEAGIIAEDNMNHLIPKIKGNGWEVDRLNPRLEVWIYDLQP